MVAGFFVGGVMVMHLTVVMDYSSKSSVASNLTIHATVFTIAGAVGYLIGGFLGDVSLSLLFAMQILGLVFSGVLAFATFDQIPISDDERFKKHTWLSDINPLSGFKLAYKYLTSVLWLFLFIVFVAQVGSIAFDQAFNFFIRDQFSFPPSYNGMLKASFGILSLIVNSTIGIFLVRKTKQQKPLAIVMLIMSVLSSSLVFIMNQPIFLVISVGLFVLNSIYLILIQTIAGTLGQKIDYSLFMGLFNAIKSLGMIFGASFVGLVYSFSPRGSFLLSAFAFGLVSLLLVILIQLKKRAVS